MNAPIKFYSDAYFSGFWFFMQPEISDMGPTAQSPSRITCTLEHGTEYINSRFTILAASSFIQDPGIFSGPYFHLPKYI
jgi:hypothetical protein